LSQRNIVANSINGVKVIKISVSEIDFVLREGSPLYLSYLRVQSHVPRGALASSGSSFATLLETNSTLRRLTPIQKRHLEALSEERVEYDPGEYLWAKGSEAKYAFIVVKGSVHFGVGKEFKNNRRRSVSCERYERHLVEKLERERSRSPGRTPPSTFGSTALSTISSLDNDSADHAAGGTTTMERRATIATSRVIPISERRVSDEVDEEILARMRATRHDTIMGSRGGGGAAALKRSRRIVNGMEVLSRGHFLANVAEMIVKDVRPDSGWGGGTRETPDGEGGSCAGTGRHSSTLRAGGNGAVVVRFGKGEFINFLDKHPGVLLSLLGTEIVV
jgi:hypothetical protein